MRVRVRKRKSRVDTKEKKKLIYKRGWLRDRDKEKETTTQTQKGKNKKGVGVGGVVGGSERAEARILLAIIHNENDERKR